MAMMPIEVEVDADADSPDLVFADQESRFFSCHVCGDNWLTVKDEGAGEGPCNVTFIHQMGMAPVLKRVARMQTHIIVTENTVDEWEYFLDDRQVDADTWHTKLKRRRETLRSVCTN